MRILLAQKLPYVPALSGASKFTRALLEGLAQRNHSCRVLAASKPFFGEIETCCATIRKKRLTISQP